MSFQSAKSRVFDSYIALYYWFERMQTRFNPLRVASSIPTACGFVCERRRTGFQSAKSRVFDSYQLSWLTLVGVGLVSIR